MKQVTMNLNLFSSLLAAAALAAVVLLILSLIPKGGQSAPSNAVATQSVYCNDSTYRCREIFVDQCLVDDRFTLEQCIDLAGGR